MISFRQWYEVNYKRALPIYLGNEEKKYLRQMFDLAQSLERVKNDTAWGLAVDLVVKAGCRIADMVTLVQQLRRQNEDNPAVMRNILGTEYDRVLGTLAVPMLKKV